MQFQSRSVASVFSSLPVSAGALPAFAAKAQSQMSVLTARCSMVSRDSCSYLEAAKNFSVNLKTINDRFVLLSLHLSIYLLTLKWKYYCVLCYS